MTQAADTAPRVFIAIPLYCSNDNEIFSYFAGDTYRRELDSITGPDLVVLIPREMLEQGNFVVYRKIRERGRFQMDIADLPCLYLEDDRGGWAALKLKGNVEELRRVFKLLSTVAGNAKTEDTALSLAAQVNANLNIGIITPLKQIRVAEGDFERIINPMVEFANPAMRRHELAKREARVARLDIDQKPVGTSWLVAPDLLLTAYHNIARDHDWGPFSCLFDHKYVPKSNSQFLQTGRRVKFVDKPLLAHSKPLCKAVELSKEGATPEYLDFALLRLAEPVGEQNLDVAESAGQVRNWFQLPKAKHNFDRREKLIILGHPQLCSESVFPLKLSDAFPSEARLTEHGCRVRYAVNTEVGSSGSPIMDDDFSPLALHHLGSEEKPAWDAEGDWPKGFNQGIPLTLIVEAIRNQVERSVCRELGIADG